MTTKKTHKRPAMPADGLALWRMALPTASSLTRAIRCEASSVLARVKEPTTYAQARGTTIHKFLQIALEEERDAALAWVKSEAEAGNVPAEIAEQCGKIDLSVFPGGVSCEVAFGYDERTGEVKVYDLELHRDYPADLLYHGTIDIGGLLDDETVYVADIKTGDHEPAKSAWQLIFAALAAAAYSGVKKARVEFLRLWPSGQWSRDAHDLSADDLDAARLRLVMLAEHLRTATPERPGGFEIGPHCTYCPALRLCPAQTVMVRAMEPSLATLSAPDGLAQLDDAAIIRVFERMERYEQAMKVVRAKLEAHVAAAGYIVAEDGRILTLVGQERRALEDGAVPALLERFGAECHGALSASIGKLSPAMMSHLAERNLVGWNATKPSLKLIRPKK